MKKSVCNTCVYAVNNKHCGLRGFRSDFNVKYCSAQNVDKLPNGFELQEDGYFSWVNKKPKYPTTFDECLNVLYCKSVLRTIIGHKAELLFNLEKLLICRDACWKIAGAEMGLGKPWKPEYVTLKDNTYFIIQTFNGEIDKSATSHRNAILAFPTIEMREAGVSLFSINSPERFLEHKGWIKIHNNEVYGWFSVDIDDLLDEPTTEQIDFIYNYIKSHYNGMFYNKSQFFIKTTPISVTKLRQMDKFALREIFSL